MVRRAKDAKRDYTVGLTAQVATKRDRERSKAPVREACASCGVRLPASNRCDHCDPDWADSLCVRRLPTLATAPSSLGVIVVVSEPSGDDPNAGSRDLLEDGKHDD